MHPGVVVVGVVVLAALLGRSARASSGNGTPFPDGVFRPEDASKQPDFERVVEGVEDGDVDWLNWVAPPGYDAIRNFATSPVDGHVYYEKQLWRPASRISIMSLTKGDFDRAAYFLAAAWKRGSAAGCEETEPDKRFREVNDELEEIASGLEIGAAIGVGLSSIFGFGEGAKASDKAFGFQRGADETREAQVDLGKLPAAAQADLETLDVRAAVKKDPNGAPQGSNIITLGGSRVIAAMANLFNISWAKWAEGNAPIDENDLLDEERGIAIVKGTDGVVRRVETGISFKLHAGGTVDPENRHEIIGGTIWLRRAFALPWHSREMGCGLSLREKVYVRARMYRTIDLIRSYLLPVEPYVAEMGGLVQDEDGVYVPELVGKYVTHSYRSPRFGAIRGTIFPPLPEDKEAASPTRTAPYAGPFDEGLSTPVNPRSVYVPPSAIDTQYEQQQEAYQTTVGEPMPSGPPSKGNTPMPKPVAPLGSIVATGASPTANTSPITLSRLSLYRGT